MDNQEAPRVDRESAELEFERFLDVMRLRRRWKKQRDAEAQANIDEAREVFIEAMQVGSLVVSENGEPTFSPESNPEKTITFRMPTGKTIMAVDGERETQKVHQFYAMLADATGETKQTFVKLPHYDMDVVQAIALLFFG